MNDKLKNFPSVNYVSLYESIDRRNFMNSQFEYYGISRVNCFVTDRYNNVKHELVTEGLGLTDTGDMIGVTISHLNMIRHWYTTCDEEYAIFCEDDISFESINYWNFTWDDFIQNLPPDWECVQLMRMVGDYDTESHDLSLSLKLGRRWGTHSLMKRSYAKKLLDKFVLGYNHYKFEMILDEGPFSFLIPCPENVLFLSILPVLNFPVLIEHPKFYSTYASEPNINAVKSHNHVLNLWKTQGLDLDIKTAMII